jgi:uncharacterized protein YyaL (SSP411 family)
MLSAFAEASLVLGEEWLSPANTAASFIRKNLWNGDRLKRRFKDGDVGVSGYLEDYAYLTRGLVDLYQTSGNVEHLAWALKLAGGMEQEFWDEDNETLYFTPESGEKLVARPQELMDQSTPSSVGVAIDMLLALSHFTPDDRFHTIAEQALKTYDGPITSNPLQHASLVLAADRYLSGSHELTIVANRLPDEWRARLGSTYLPNRLLSRRPPELSSWLESLDLQEIPPIWANREPEGEPTIYACRNFSCSRPLTNIDDALKWFAD